MLMTPPRSLGAVAVLVAAALLLGLSIWASFHSLFPGEQELERWLQHHPGVAILGYEEFADQVGARRTLYVLTGIGFVLFLALQRWRLLALVLTAPLLTLFGHLLKIIVERPRPALHQVVDIREPTTGFSFPSGHSLQATIVCLVAVIVVQHLFSGRFRRFLQLGAIWLALTVGWERVFDGVHWPTDVVAGGLLGFILIYTTWAVINAVADALQRRQEARSGGAQPRTARQSTAELP
jgi:undecaprenyl-diphosphatase